MPSALKVGKKGGTYYVSDKGKKVYADKLPGTKEPKKPQASKDKKATPKGKEHPKAAKYAGKETGYTTPDGQQIFKIKNHFYINPTTGKKVILTKGKVAELKLGGKKVGGAKKKATAQKESSKLKEAKQDLASAKDHVAQMKKGGQATSNEIDLGQKKVKAYEDKVSDLGGPTTDKLSTLKEKNAAAKADLETLKKSNAAKKAELATLQKAKPSGKEHPKAAKYAGKETGNTTPDGQQIFKIKNHFYINPTTGKKVILTKKAAKAQGISGGSKTKSPGKGVYSTKAAADAQQKGFKAQALGTKVTTAAMDQWGDLPHSQQSALKHYTGSGYTTINNGLRKPPPHQATKHRIDSMDKAFSNTVSTKHDYTVYRSTSTNSGRIPPPVGGLYEDDGYSSSSFKKGQAGKFKGHKKNQMLMTVDVPKGSKAIYMGKTSNHKTEKELLIDRGAKIRIVSRIKKGGIWHIKGILESTHNSK